MITPQIKTLTISQTLKTYPLLAQRSDLIVGTYSNTYPCIIDPLTNMMYIQKEGRFTVISS